MEARSHMNGKLNNNFALAVFLLAFFFFPDTIFALESDVEECVSICETGHGNIYRSATLTPSFAEIRVNKPALFAHDEIPEQKSRARARIYSVVFTTVPISLSRVASKGWALSDQSITSLFLISSGALFGPSAGSIYADDWSLARNGIYIRSACALVVLAGAVMREKYADDSHLKSVGTVAQLTGLGFLAGSALYDIIFVSVHSVDYHNVRIRLDAGISTVSSLEKPMSVHPGFVLRLRL